MLVVCIIYVGFNPVNKINTHKNSYQRIVSLAPSFCETLEALEEDHRLVGVTINSQIERAKNLNKIGSFAQPNLEAILSLNPDLVLAVPHVLARPIINALKENNIEIFSYQPDSLKDIKYIINNLSKKFNNPKKGQELIERMDRVIMKEKENLKPYLEKLFNKTALIAVSPSPLVVAGKNTFASQIIEHLGLKNESDNKNVPWPIWPIEKLLKDPPKFFIIAQGTDAMGSYKEILNSFFNENFREILIIPKKSIFSMPSPKVIYDIKYFSKLLQNKLKNDQIEPTKN